MDDTRKTLFYVGVAVVLALLAYLAVPDRIVPSAFLDQGDAFFPDFTDPNDAISLEIVGYDDNTASATPFKVHFKDGQWTIPSHHDYPADAKDRLAKTAAGLIDIKKDDFRSDNPADYASLGVIDPLDETATSSTGRGRRVTVRGKNDVVLADFIVGNEVPSRAGFRFVRVPDQKRVYAARMDVDLSAQFSDWINRDLLEVDRADINRVVIHDYTIDERTRRVNNRDKVTLNLAGDVWKVAGAGSSSVVDTNAMTALLNGIDSLSIVGVRPKPAGLSQSLTAQKDGASMSQADLLSLQSKGYYLSRDGQLLSNEGELEIRSTKGVVYHLRFGEVLYGAGLSVTAGTGGGDSGDGGTEARYLFLTTEFDPSVFPEPPRPTSDAFRAKPDSLLTDEDRENRNLGAAHDRWEQEVASGRQLAQSLNDRYANWYFVISAENFDRLNADRAQLVDRRK